MTRDFDFLQTLKRGDIVTVELYGGETGQRRVVEVLLSDPRNPRVHICAESGMAIGAHRGA